MIAGYLLLWLIYIAGIAVLVAYEERLGRNAFAVIGWVTLVALAALAVWTSYAARQIFNYLRVVRHAPPLVAFLLAVLYYLACIPFGFVLVPHAHRLTTTHHLEQPDGILPIPFLWDPD